ncbi:hypothetical protein DMB66_25620 [Actinoplanes sp. ATCC 53533]|nr:hypothetical protein DMB66_25620 [Actinoplanes sp. ATCC 53533]
MAGTSRLFAVWPGDYSSDLFVIDDLDAYARAVGLIHDETRTGLAAMVPIFLETFSGQVTGRHPRQLRRAVQDSLDNG